MSTIPVTFYRSATYIEERTAFIEPAKYIAWCTDDGAEPNALENVKRYIDLDYTGDFHEREGEYEDSEFRDFERADYADQLVAAASARKPLTEDDLKAIAKMELEKEFRPGRAISLIQMDHEMTYEESDRFREILDSAKITVTI